MPGLLHGLISKKHLPAQLYWYDNMGDPLSAIISAIIESARLIDSLASPTALTMQSNPIRDIVQSNLSNLEALIGLVRLLVRTLG